MSRKLFVHVGPKKTATSTIQGFLREHDGSTVIYPRVGLFADGAHHCLVYKFFGENKRLAERLARKPLDAFLRKLSAETIDSDKSVVLSSEELETRDISAFIRGVLPYISRTPMDVRIIVACREHFERTASWYNMHVRAPHKHLRRHQPLPDQFLEKRAARVCYAPLVSKLTATGFPVTVLNYHPSSTWVARFLKHIGFDESDIPKVLANKRPGLSIKTLIAALGTNACASTADERQAFLQAFANMPGAYGSAKHIFGREAALAAEQIFSEDRKFLAEACGVRLDPPDLESQSNHFVIGRSEFDEIVAVADSLGDRAAGVVEFAQRFVRDTADTSVSPSHKELQPDR